LFLKVLEAWKPAFKAVFFLTEKIVDNHHAPVGELLNKVEEGGCQEGGGGDFL
jgi:hypothetical protein